MTQDEAEKIVDNAWPKISYLSGIAGQQGASNAAQADYRVALTPRTFVKLAVALGILKLEEPKRTQTESFFETMTILYSRGVSDDIKSSLDARGLKIVEK